jgi:hypothetical protein
MEASYSSLCEKVKYDDACNGLEVDLKKFNDLRREMQIDFEKSSYKIDDINERNISVLDCNGIYVEKSLIEEKQSEIDKIKQLLQLNKYEPNLSSFIDHNSDFGSLIFFNSLNYDTFKSQILASGQQTLDLIELCKFSLRDKWTLLYRGTRDGFETRDFHSKCDGKSSALTPV